MNHVQAGHIKFEFSANFNGQKVGQPYVDGALQILVPQFHLQGILMQSRHPPMWVTLAGAECTIS